MIKQRVMQLIECKGLPKERFFKDLGVSSANFRAANAKTPLNSSTIENILTMIPDANPEWLITGNGEMLKNPEKKSPEPIEEPMYSLPLSAWRVIESQMKSLETSVQQNKEVIEMLRDERKKTGNDAGGHFPAASAAGED